MRPSGWNQILNRLRSEAGSAAAEFALVIPLCVLLTIGIFNLTALLYAENALHYSVERAARCTSLTPTACPNLQTYGASLYKGPRVTPVYTLVAATTTSPRNCGNRVTATGTFAFQTGLVRINVPVSASSCFPLTS